MFIFLFGLQGSDLQNNETKLSSPLIGPFSLIRGYKKYSAFPLVTCFCFVVLFCKSDPGYINNNGWTKSSAFRNYILFTVDVTIYVNSFSIKHFIQNFYYKNVRVDTLKQIQTVFIRKSKYNKNN